MELLTISFLIATSAPLVRLRILFAVFAALQLYATEIVDAIFERYERPFTFLGIGEGAERGLVKNAPLYPESVFIQFAKQISI